MRPLLGYLVYHAVLIATGLTVLYALGLVRWRWGAALVALGPAYLVGTALVVPLLVVLIIVGVPLTPVSAVLTCAGCAGGAVAVGHRRPGRRAAPATSGAEEVADGPRPHGRLTATAGQRIGLAASAAAIAYVGIGAFALARLPTVWDDARIWSLRALTLFYYHGLQPAIFLNPAQSGGHPVYPLFQPVLEASLYQAMGRPELRLLHTELWLLFVAAIWTVGYLAARGGRRLTMATLGWSSALAALAFTPAAIDNVAMGYADVAGSVMLGVGLVAFGLWIERSDAAMLAVAALTLAAAANIKDETLVAAVLVFVLGAVATPIARRGGDRAWSPPRVAAQLGAAAAYFAAMVAPWRIWTAVHRLSDSVEPPLPKALNPGYVFGRSHQLHRTLSAMASQTMHEWRWLVVIFVAACAVGMASPTLRRVAVFYLISFVALVASLVWLYTTTRISLSFLIPTSMGRTIDVFMVPAALATAHLLARLAVRPGR